MNITQLKIVDDAPSNFYLTVNQLRFFELIVKRESVTRGTCFDYLYGQLPDADQPQDDCVLDQMMVVVRRQCRTEGVDILTTSQGWQIPKNQKVRAQKLLEIAKAQPKRQAGKKANGSHEHHVETQKWKIETGIPKPRRFEIQMKYPWPKMIPGQSVKVWGGNSKWIQRSLLSFRKQHEPAWRFSTAKESGSVRVWRDQ